ncbi:hypothetical protein Ancab_012020 [Ancistrocladus abbreviatus]
MEKISVSGLGRSTMNKHPIKEDQERGIRGKNLGENTPKKRLERSKAVAMDERKVEEEPKKLERTTTEEVNASAEAFIKNFRKQLLLQRLESMENYEQMLARGL